MIPYGPLVIRSLKASATLACVGLLAACAGTSGAAGGSDTPPVPVISSIPGVTATPTTSDAAQVVLPIDAFLASGEQIAQTSKAMITLEERCANKYGFKVTIPQPGFSGFGPNTRRYGVPESLEVAQKFGFHMTKNDPRSIPQSSGNGPDEEVRKVLTGTSAQGPISEYRGIPVAKGGCAAEASQTISGSDSKRAAHADIAEEIRAHSFEFSKLDPRVIGAQDSWSTCMKSRGYNNYKVTFDAGGDKQWDAPLATSQEITVAVADWECAKAANVVGIWMAVETAYQNKQIDLHAEELKDSQASLREQSKRIAAIIAGAGGTQSPN